MSTPYNRLRRRVPYLTPPFAGGRHPLERLLGDGNDDLPPTLADLGIADRVAVDDAPPPLRRGMLPNWDAGEIEMLPEPSRNFTPRPPMSAPPPMILGRDGRPASVVAEGDDLDRLAIKRRALESYQPQRESKKHLLLRTLLSLPMGGLVGSGGVAETLLGRGGVMDRRGLDRQWQQQELAKVGEQYGQLRLDRRAGLQDRLLESQVAENEAQAQRALRAPAVKDLEVGGRLLRPNASGGYDEVYAPPIKPGTERRPLLRTVTRSDGSTLTKRSDDNGKTWQDVPELQGAPKPSEDKPDYRQRADWYYKKQQEAETAAQDLRQQANAIKAVSVDDDLRKADLLRRAATLENEARQYRDKGDEAATMPVPGARNSDMEQKIRKAAEAKGLSGDEAVKRYRSGKY